MLDLKLSDNQGVTQVALAGEMTIYSAAECREALQGHLAAHRRLEVNLAGVTELDTAGVQVLHWLKRRAAAGGGELVLTHHSHAVVEVLDLLNLAGPFGDTILIQPARS